MRIDSLLRRFTSLKVERPPEIWDVDGDEARVAGLLDAMLAAVKERGESGDVILNISNVVVEPPDDGEEMLHPAIGEYVALSVLSPVDLGPDDTWHPATSDVSGLLLEIQPSLQGLSNYAYVRRLIPRGSVTVFLPSRQTR